MRLCLSVCCSFIWWWTICQRWQKSKRWWWTLAILLVSFQVVQVHHVWFCPMATWVMTACLSNVHFASLECSLWCSLVCLFCYKPLLAFLCSSLCKEWCHYVPIEDIMTSLCKTWCHYVPIGDIMTSLCKTWSLCAYWELNDIAVQNMLSLCAYWAHTCNDITGHAWLPGCTRHGGIMCDSVSAWWLGSTRHDVAVYGNCVSCSADGAQLLITGDVWQVFCTWSDYVRSKRCLESVHLQLQWN